MVSRPIGIVRCLEGVLWTLWMYVGFRWGVHLARRWPDEGPSNCLIWALRQQGRHGGDIVLTASQHGPWLHGYWRSRMGALMEFSPIRSRKQFRLLRWGIPPPLFHGRAQEWRPRKETTD